MLLLEETSHLVILTIILFTEEYMKDSVFAEECSRKGKLGARLKRERKELNENMAQMQISEEPLEDGYYNVDEIIDRYKKGNRIVFKVMWSGYDKPTEVLRTSLIKDVPEMVKEFERSMKRQKIM